VPFDFLKRKKRPEPTADGSPRPTGDLPGIPFDGLTEREREVLKLVAEGYSGTEIAEQLVISPKTVDTYRERIMQKLGLRHRYELVRYALRKGMLKAE